MRFLIDSHGYFEGRASVPFVPGLVAVLMTSGLNFFTSVVSFAWVNTLPADAVPPVLTDISVDTFASSFFLPFLMWLALATLLYIFTVFIGRIRVTYLTQLNVVGLGFVPLVAASAIELIMTSYYVLTASGGAVPATTFVLRAGGFGILPAVALVVVYVVAIVWGGHVWNGAIHQLGGISPRWSTAISVVVMTLVFIERLIIVVL